MSSFIPIVSSSPPPFDEVPSFETSHEDDEWDGFTAASGTATAEARTSDLVFKPVSSDVALAEKGGFGEFAAAGLEDEVADDDWADFSSTARPDDSSSCDISSTFQNTSCYSADDELPARLAFEEGVPKESFDVCCPSAESQEDLDCVQDCKSSVQGCSDGVNGVQTPGSPEGGVQSAGVTSSHTGQVKGDTPDVTSQYSIADSGISSDISPGHRRIDSDDFADFADAKHPNSHPVGSQDLEDHHKEFKIKSDQPEEELEISHKETTVQNGDKCLSHSSDSGHSDRSEKDTSGESAEAAVKQDTHNALGGVSCDNNINVNNPVTEDNPVFMDDTFLDNEDLVEDVVSASLAEAQDGRDETVNCSQTQVSDKTDSESTRIDDCSCSTDVGREIAISDDSSIQPLSSSDGCSLQDKEALCDETESEISQEAPLPQDATTTRAVCDEENAVENPEMPHETLTAENNGTCNQLNSEEVSVQSGSALESIVDKDCSVLPHESVPSVAAETSDVEDGSPEEEFTGFSKPSEDPDSMDLNFRPPSYTDDGAVPPQVDDGEDVFEAFTESVADGNSDFVMKDPADSDWAAFGEAGDTSFEGAADNNTGDWAAFQDSGMTSSSQTEQDDEFGDFGEPETGDTDFDAFQDHGQVADVQDDVLSVDPEKVLSQCYNQGLDTVNSRSIQMLVGVMEQEIKRKIEEPEVEPEPPGLMRPQQRAKEAKRVSIDINVWNRLKDVEKTPALKYQWTSSGHSARLLHAVGIDRRNLLIGMTRKPIPVFFQQGVLEPSRSGSEESYKSSSSSPSHTPAPDILIPDTSRPSLPAGTPQDIPPAEFDWSSSGLTNPLDASNSVHLDLDFFTQNDRICTGAALSARSSAVLQKEQELLQAIEPSRAEPPKTLQPLENILANMKFTPTTPQGPEKEDEDQLSDETRGILCTISDLSYMTATVLMFPIKSHELED